MRTTNLYEVYSKICGILILLDLYDETHDEIRKQQYIEKVRSIAREILKIL